jgi:hypothetical protein
MANKFVCFVRPRKYCTLRLVEIILPREWVVLVVMIYDLFQVRLFFHLLALRWIAAFIKPTCNDQILLVQRYTHIFYSAIWPKKTTLTHLWRIRFHLWHWILSIDACTNINKPIACKCCPDAICWWVLTRFLSRVLFRICKKKRK